MNSYLFVSLCIILSAVAVQSAGELTQAEINTIVSTHNQWRASPSPAASTTIPALVWNTTMATRLQNHASKCDGKFSPEALNSINSEWKYTSSPTFNVGSILSSVLASSANYDWNAKACQSGKSCLWVTSIWAKSRQIACAKSLCSGKHVFFCDFYPAGNYIGVAPYTPVSTPKPTSTPTSTPKPTSTPTKPPGPTTPGTPSPTGTPAPTTPSPTAGAGSTDWSSRITPVRDQGGCGSCWAFSAVAVLEGRSLLQKGGDRNTLDLSEQNALSCIASGCGGGWYTNVYSQLKTDGITYESAEPYKAVEGTCVKTGGNRLKWVSYANVANNKAALIAELANGPINVAVMVDDAFQNYRSGVFSCATKYTSVNHAVTLVGYNKPGDYWIIKNSWNTWWGEAGFIRLTAANDNCNMLAYAGSTVSVV
eukprot:gene18028-21520_t